MTYQGPIKHPPKTYLQSVIPIKDQLKPTFNSFFSYQKLVKNQLTIKQQPSKNLPKTYHKPVTTNQNLPKTNQKPDKKPVKTY